jgi:hypothetical protein
MIIQAKVKSLFHNLNPLLPVLGDANVLKGTMDPTTLS